MEIPMTAHAWSFNESAYQLWLLRIPSNQAIVMSSSSRRPDYYRLLGVLETADESEINTAYRRLVLSCHPDKIPSSDSEEVRNAKIKRFRTLGDAKSILLDPVLRAEYDLNRGSGLPDETSSEEPFMTLRDAFVVWGTTIMKAFNHSNPDNIAAVSLIGALGIPAIMIAMGGAEHGGRLCMTFALMLARDSLVEEFRCMSEEDLRIFRQAVLILEAAT